MQKWPGFELSGPIPSCSIWTELSATGPEREPASREVENGEKDGKSSHISQMRNQFPLCNILLHLVVLSPSCSVSRWDLN